MNFLALPAPGSIQYELPGRFFLPDVRTSSETSSGLMHVWSLSVVPLSQSVLSDAQPQYALQCSWQTYLRHNHGSHDKVPVLHSHWRCLSLSSSDVCPSAYREVHLRDKRIPALPYLTDKMIRPDRARSHRPCQCLTYLAVTSYHNSYFLLLWLSLRSLLSESRLLQLQRHPGLFL